MKTASRALAISKEEAAKLLGISTWSVDSLIQDGKLRTLKIGHGEKRQHVRIFISELEALKK